MAEDNAREKPREERAALELEGSRERKETKIIPRPAVKKHP